MAHWALAPVEGDTHTATMCEHHALIETNAMVSALGLGHPFGSMHEAWVILSALMAVAGFDLGMQPTETEQCEACDRERMSA
jgi:hypothetical protein